MNDLGMVPHIAVLLSAIAVFASAIYLVLNQRYHAGFIGTAGLVLLIVASASRAAALLDLGPHRVSTIAVLTWIGIALFIGRLALKFHRRCGWGAPLRDVDLGRKPHSAPR